MPQAKRFILAALFCLLVQNLWARTVSVSYNEATVVELQDNDEIRLVDFPSGWYFRRVVLGVNSIPGVPFSGSLVANDCIHELRDYYEEFDFAYTGNEKIVYHGLSQKLPIQWWLDANPVMSSCKSYSEKTRQDSLLAVLNKFADSTYSERIKNFKDLGAINSETIFEGSAARFRITELPSWSYNRLYIQVEPLDGKILDGRAYSGGTMVEVNGYSSQFAVNQKTYLAPTFELAFPEYRKVRLRWWAETRSPVEQLVRAEENVIAGDSVEVEYFFGLTPYTEKSLKLVFDKGQFADGKVPEVKRLSFNPQGPNKTKDLAVRGEIFDFKASLKEGESVTLAIPLNFEYRPGQDSVTVEHFIEAENRWVEEPVDSIVGNYAYFRAGHFSWFRSALRSVWKAASYAIPAVAVCAAVSETCEKNVDKFVNEAADLGANLVTGAVDGVAWVGKFLENLACLDGNGIKKLFGMSRSSSWSVPQGTVNVEAILQKGAGLIDILKEKRGQDLKKMSEVEVNDDCGNIETCRWQETGRNLDILLADAILAQFPKNKSEPSFGNLRFGIEFKNEKAVLKKVGSDSAYNFADYFMTKSDFVQKAVRFVDGVESCYDGISFDGRQIQNIVDAVKNVARGSYTGTCKSLFAIMGFDEISHLGDVPNCIEFIGNSASDKYSIMEAHQNKLQAISDVMVRISLLGWLKKADGFRNFSLLAYKTAYDGIRSWLSLAGPFFDYNNIAIKAFGSLSLYEYVHYGTDENLQAVNGGLNRHYGSNGGYSEGTGYSQYIWDDLTYVLSALQDAHRMQGDDAPRIHEKFLKSPDHMFEFSRPVGVASANRHYGLIPVEIDDGVTYNPDYRVWAKLKNEPKYLAIAEEYPLKSEDGKINVLVSFGFPEMGLYHSASKVLPGRGSLWGSFEDGVGIIVAVTAGDTVALSMIAEDGNLWTRGQSHDQQDNLSVTLASSRNGFLVQDRGYSGFDKRSSGDGFHRYADHNVLTNELGQADNKTIPIGEIWSRLYGFTEDFPGLESLLLIGGFEVYSRIFDIGYEFSVEGGNAASVLDKKINEPQNGVVGFTAKTILQGTPYGNVNFNNRTILYFGGTFWVIDRPSASGMKWLANSSVASLGNFISLYSSARTEKLGLTGTSAWIPQNMNRGDFNGKQLVNYSYSARDKDSRTYVMTYAVNGEGTFFKDSSRCPKDFQCFVNSDGDTRIVVPPSGQKFDLCDVLAVGECSGNVRSDGITLFVRGASKEWTTRWVLDGNLYASEKGVESVVESATVSRTSYSFGKSDGTVVTGKYSSPYLPAIPILLLR